MMKRVALYPGSFDPLTNGHLDLIKRSLKLFDELYVGVLENPSKRALFTADERVAMASQVVKPMKRVRVVRFDGLLVQLARRIGNPTVIRGLRMISDFEYEFQMAQMNRKMLPGYEVVFMMPDEKVSYLSSTLVRQIATRGGNVGPLVPPIVARCIRAKVKQG
jgi:pantetheine-phosphate adenylyltransferase